MTIPVYPSDLPQILQSGYTLKTAPNMLRTQMADGCTRQRVINMSGFRTAKYLPRFPGGQILDPGGKSVSRSMSQRSRSRGYNNGHCGLSVISAGVFTVRVQPENTA